MKKIDGKTRICGLIGNPVEHTLSPLIHNTLAGDMGQNLVYVPLRVEENAVGDAVRGAYALNLLGMNVTVPHKSAVLPYLKDVDELAEKIGISSKTVSKWETAKGYPDISLLEPLASILGVSITELISGNAVSNVNVSANMLRSKFYVCPVCQNVIHTMGDTVVSCCGITLPALEAEEYDILGIKVPSITVPVHPGRNLAAILEIAAMNFRLKRMGYNTAEEFNKRLMESIGGGSN